MRSPFPGMDPFIEACGWWEDFHSKLIGGLEQTLSALVPDRYFVGIGQRYDVEETFRETFIEIRQVHERSLVTVIESLSPSNKRYGSEGWRLYARKRQACFEDDTVSLVELDLLRGGQRHPMKDPWPPSPYYVLLRRQGHGHNCRVWPAHSLRPLPRVPIPLSKPDPDIEVDLQTVVDAIFARCRYASVLDYSRSLKPPLEPGEVERLSGHKPAAGASP
ncbi:MAG: DUF4058 family protein [Planctomycetes bacterium]|nr:DUF4058 family protein [Planctomycetota bacterium]